MEFDAIVRISFLSTEEGGKTTPIIQPSYACPMIVDGQYHDCRLILDDIGNVYPGQTITVPVKFLDPASVRCKLQPGHYIELWELRIIARGEVLIVRKQK